MGRDGKGRRTVEEDCKRQGKAREGKINENENENGRIGKGREYKKRRGMEGKVGGREGKKETKGREGRGREILSRNNLSLSKIRRYFNSPTQELQNEFFELYTDINICPS